ncbi:Hypothetical protein FKW44_017718 [Caligus rogercresseyi]|uniref:Uncharacterized protein n=1 Tax=Caligus rogercresseyi TaxID=217165 RepID=A0A7T8JXG1_CALRO|nr:Hypothetical protein FKW44_017718 [Caligus rogercresseyi]
MFLSFFLVTALTHFSDWDPLLDFFKWVCGRCGLRRGARAVGSLEGIHRRGSHS